MYLRPASQLPPKKKAKYAKADTTGVADTDVVNSVALEDVRTAAGVANIGAVRLRTTPDGVNRRRKNTQEDPFDALANSAVHVYA